MDSGLEKVKKGNDNTSLVVPWILTFNKQGTSSSRFSKVHILLEPQRTNPQRKGKENYQHTPAV